jgi:hypothetical protein
MGGKSDDSSSRRMIAMQEEEAREARAKEAARKKRIDTGLSKIKAAFHGTEGKKTVAGKATKLAEGSLPAGYKIQEIGGTPATTKTVQTNDERTGRNINKTVMVPGKAGKKVVIGPDGKQYALGSTVTPSSVVGTGQFTGGPEDFLKEYEQGYLANYLPQVAQKFKEAKDETTYALARAGTLNSQAAADELAKLIEQNKLNEADVKTKASEAVGSLRGRLADEEAKATSQLYSTENPEVAASNALHAVQNITAEEPSTTPLGAIFDVAAIGGANYLRGGSNKYYRDKYVPGNQPGGYVVTA